MLAACLGVWALKKLGVPDGDRPEMQGAILLALVLALAPVRAAGVAPPLRVLHRVVVGFFGLYAIASYPAVSDAYLAESLYARAIHDEGRWLVAAAALAAWWRPGFGLIPVVYLGWKKTLMAEQFGFTMNATDYIPVAELGLFVCLAIGAVAAAEAAGRRLSLASPGRTDGRADGRWTLGEGAFVAAFALHAANYFYSAVAKATLPGAGFWTWALENDTHDIMLATASIGLGPLLGVDWLAYLAHEAMDRFQHVTNVVTYLLQYAALVALVRIRLAMLTALAWDAMHLAIFVTTSILFWKWMAVNIGFALAFGLLLDRRAPPWPLFVMGTGVLLLAPLLFWVATLGWFDSRALNRPSVVAVTEDGREVRVPSNYFLEGSAQMSKGHVGKPYPGHFADIGVFGKAEAGLPGREAAEDCDLPVAAESGLSEAFAREPKLERYFREHHRFMLANVGEDGQYPYNWYPHHNWSNPALFTEFGSLDLREIVAYRYVIESLCFRYDGRGGIEHDVRLRGVHTIPVEDVRP
ncbi:MAG: hypothetical protein ACFBWO_11295 [Paracoccaceae bacterium]